MDLSSGRLAIVNFYFVGKMDRLDRVNLAPGPLSVGGSVLKWRTDCVDCLNVKYDERACCVQKPRRVDADIVV